MHLTEQGSKLLALLVTEIAKGRFDARNPETFLGYGEALEMLKLPPDAPHGQTDGQTLQLNGLNDLARWIRINGKLPKVTGLFVSKQGSEKGTPGAGYFKEYGIARNGKEYAWWLEESRKSIAFDWSPHVSAEETFEPDEVRYVGTVSEGTEHEVPTKIRQRSQKLRDLAREHFRLKSPKRQLYCAVCDWAKPAFPLAHEIIEIHHTEEMSTLPKAGRKLTLAEALALLTPLCPTCHRMLHAKPGGGSFTVEELREYMRNPPV